MKKLILSLIILIVFGFSCDAAFSEEKISLTVHKNESYLILLNEPAKTVMSGDTEVVEPEMLTTLYNEKNQILTKVLKEGRSRVYISTQNEVLVINFTVVGDDVVIGDDILQPKSEIIKVITKIDKAPVEKTAVDKEKQFELDSPPALRGKY